MKSISRRKMLGVSTRTLAAIGAGLPMLAQTAQRDQTATLRKLRIVFAGAHPDDPESGCGGTIALYSGMGYEVSVFYLTRGEAGIPGKTAEQAGAIRTVESQKACSILNARPVFVGQVDGGTEVNRERYSQFQRLLEAEHPDIVFTHWPIDTHPDHRVISLLVYEAWLQSGKKFDLYYFEVEQGAQTQLFHPTTYVDITRTEKRKREACFAHASQQPGTGFYLLHEKMNQFRGMECGCELAEAFVRHNQNPPARPPDLRHDAE